MRYLGFGAGARSSASKSSESGQALRMTTSSRALPRGSVSCRMPHAVKEQKQAVARDPTVFLGEEAEERVADRALPDEPGWRPFHHFGEDLGGGATFS
eukprot:5891360-Alexandrium_andersonii.AAC.1